MFRKLRNLLIFSAESTVKYKFQAISFVLIFLMAYTLDLLAPWFLGYILQHIANTQLDSDSIKYIFTLLLWYVLVRVTVVSLHHFARIIQIRTGFESKLESLKTLLMACLSYPLKWHLKRHSGENLNRIHRASAAVEAVISTYIWQIIDGLVKVIFAIAAIAYLNFKVVVIVVLTSTVSVYFMLVFNRKLLEYVRAMNFFWDRLNKYLVDTLTNIVTVKMLSIENALNDRLAKLHPQGSNIFKKLPKYMEFKWGSVGIGFAIMTGLAIMVYILDFKSRGESVDIAKIYVLLDYLNRINQAIASFTGYYGGLLESATNFEEGYEILTGTPKYEQKNLTNGELFRWNKITIKHLLFRYTLSDLSGIECSDLTILNGDKIAVVGSSGSGKSTLMKCLAGLVEPQKFEIYSDGHEISPIYLQSQTILIPQEPELFADTIRFNLEFNRDIPESTVLQALRIAEIDELINRLPQGLETDLGHQGLSISVGEKQRLALARGLIMAHDYEIILLDEPTSSVDAITERLIFSKILSFFAAKTIFCTIHRLSMVSIFDKIIVVKDGKVIEFGSFDDLVALRGQFFRLWSEFINSDPQVIVS